jgi:hypothetical protein
MVRGIGSTPVKTGKRGFESRRRLMLEKGEHATQEWYEESQKIPERIEGATKGKMWVTEFMEWCALRHHVEHPDDVERYETDGLYRYSDTMELFQKYMVEQMVDLGTGRKSMVVCYVEASNGETYLWHNLLGPTAYRVLRERFVKLAKGCRKSMRIAKKRK